MKGGSIEPPNHGAPVLDANGDRASMKGGSIEPPNDPTLDIKTIKELASMKGGSIEPPNRRDETGRPQQLDGFNEGGLY